MPLLVVSTIFNADRECARRKRNVAYRENRMKALIQDQHALRAITPAALVAYAVGEGWERQENFGDHSDAP